LGNGKEGGKRGEPGMRPKEREKLSGAYAIRGGGKRSDNCLGWGNEEEDANRKANSSKTPEGVYRPRHISGRDSPLRASGKRRGEGKKRERWKMDEKRNIRLT